MMTPLAQSARIAAELRARLAEAYGLDADDEVIDDTVAGECDLPEQIARLVRDVARAEAHAEGLAGLIKAEQARKARLEAKAEKLRSLIAWGLSEGGYRKMELPEATLTLSKGKPALIVDDVPLSQVAPEFKRVTESLDKAAIRAALADGGQLEFARLGNAAPTLTIRRS